MRVCKAVTEAKGNILVEPTRKRQHILDWLKHSLFAIQSNTCNFIVLTSLVLIYNVEINESQEKTRKEKVCPIFWLVMQKTNALQQSKRWVQTGPALCVHVRGQQLTMCGSRMLARLRMRARLRPDSSMNRASFCSSMILFSCSMLFRFFSMEEIYKTRATRFL